MAVGGAFPDKGLIAELTAKMLLEVEAIHFNSDKPFIFTSGWASPVYIDCRKLISYPRLRQTIIDFGASILLRDAGFERFVPFFENAHNVIAVRSGTTTLSACSV